MPVPSIPGSHAAATIVVALSLSFVACDSSRMLSGVFRSEEIVVVDGVSGFPEGCWLELMIAQFGPDITGIVRVFGEDQFVVPASGMCPCRYITTGSVDERDLSFAFLSNGDCPGSEQTPLIIGSFTYMDPDPIVGQNSDDYLTGTLVIEGGDRSSAQTVTLHRVKVWTEVSGQDLQCDDPIVHGVGPESGAAAR